MSALRRQSLPTRGCAFAAVLLALIGSAAAVQAQEQESVAMQRMLHPDQTLKFNDADRKFDGSAAVGSKQAVVRPFLFSHPASTKAGDGTFRTHDFGVADVKGYHTADFTTKPSAFAGRDEYDQNGKLFAVRAVAVNDDRATGKTLAGTRAYVSSEKPFLGRGKRQDAIDDLRSQKQMTIEQVRELLNKNN